QQAAEQRGEHLPGGLVGAGREQLRQGGVPLLAEVPQRGAVQGGYVELVPDQGLGAGWPQVVQDEVGQRGRQVVLPLQLPRPRLDVRDVVFSCLFQRACQQVVQGGEVVRRRSQRNTGRSGNGTVSQLVHPAFGDHLDGCPCDSLPAAGVLAAHPGGSGRCFRG